MEVRIIYSRKRSRTVSARAVGDTMVVNAPAAMPKNRLEKVIESLKTRIERRKLKEDLNKKRPLDEIASALNERYFGGRLKINSIEYAADQSSKFGCCNYRTANIRISHRLSRVPEWVRDYVIIHEMAHLIEPNHSGAFWDIVSRYKLAERARGYLMASGLDNGEDQDIVNPQPEINRI